MPLSCQHLGTAGMQGAGVAVSAILTKVCGENHAGGSRGHCHCLLGPLSSAPCSRWDIPAPFHLTVQGSVVPWLLAHQIELLPGFRGQGSPFPSPHSALLSAFGKAAPAACGHA